MKKIILFLFLYATAWTSAETQTWTSTTGTTVEAELMEYANRIVVLKTASGRKLTLPLAKLVPEDQAVSSTHLTLPTTPSVENPRAAFTLDKNSTHNGQGEP